MKGTPFDKNIGSLNLTSTFLSGYEISRNSLASVLNKVLRLTSEQNMALADPIYGSPKEPRRENIAANVTDEIEDARISYMRASIAKDLPKPESPIMTKLAKSRKTPPISTRFSKVFDKNIASKRKVNSSESLK